MKKKTQLEIVGLSLAAIGLVVVFFTPQILYCPTIQGEVSSTGGYICYFLGYKVMVSSLITSVVEVFYGGVILLGIGLLLFFLSWFIMK